MANASPAQTDGILSIANFSCEFESPGSNEIYDKDCFGATPKPTRETRGLPRRLRLKRFLGLTQLPLAIFKARKFLPECQWNLADRAITLLGDD